MRLRFRFWPNCRRWLANNLALQPAEVGLHEQILLAAALDVLVPDSGGNLPHLGPDHVLAGERERVMLEMSLMRASMARVQLKHEWVTTSSRETDMVLLGLVTRSH